MLGKNCLLLCSAFVLTACMGGGSDEIENTPDAPYLKRASLRASGAETLSIALSNSTKRLQVLDTFESEVEVTLGPTGLNLVPADDIAASLVVTKRGSSQSKVVVAYAPDGDESQWTEIPAFGENGEEIALDPWVEPDAIVLVVQSPKGKSLSDEIAEANLTLQKHSLQREPTEITHVNKDRTTTRLDAIRLSDDKEPWILGESEIYAIVSGVIEGNKPQLFIAELPYLTEEEKKYSPKQIVIDWGQFEFQVANIQLFEHDDDTNYQTLVSELIRAVGAIGTFAGKPEVQVVSEIANRIVAAMPASWFSNDDDYVDSFYTIEKNSTYKDYSGAAGNARVTLTPYVVKANDE